MGSIILEKFIDSKLFSSENITVLKPSEFKNKSLEVNYCNSLSTLINNNYCADLVFICVKPQNSQEILSQIAKSSAVNKDTIFVSLMAGKTINFLKKNISPKAKIIRIMPNIAFGDKDFGALMALCYSKTIKDEQKTIFYNLFNNFCSTILEINDEKKFDTFTAIFSSGLAYVFFIASIIQNISQKNLSLNQETSANLTKKLFLSSANILNNSNSNDFSNLIDLVASKQGVTAQALEIFKANDKMFKLFNKAINQAVKRTKQL